MGLLFKERGVNAFLYEKPYFVKHIRFFCWNDLNDLWNWGKISSLQPIHINPSHAVRIYPAFENSVDPDQLASEEANWSGSAPFFIKYVNLYQQSGLSNLIGWQIEMGVAS